MRYKIVLTYLDGSTNTNWITQDSFQPIFGYSYYTATGEDGQIIYINRQAIRKAVYSEVEE